MTNCAICLKNNNNNSILLTREIPTFIFNKKDQIITQETTKILCNHTALHIFHKKCINSLKTNKCPLCRGTFDSYINVKNQNFKSQKIHKISTLSLKKLKEILTFFINNNETASEIFNIYQKTLSKKFIKKVNKASYKSLEEKTTFKKIFIENSIYPNFFIENLKNNHKKELKKLAKFYLTAVYLPIINCPYQISDFILSIKHYIKLHSMKKLIEYLEVKELVKPSKQPNDYKKLKNRVEIIQNWEKTKILININDFIILILNMGLIVSIISAKIIAEKYSYHHYYSYINCIPLLTLSIIPHIYVGANYFEYLKQKTLTKRSFQKLN